MERKKNQNSDLINCLIPGNKRLQGGMDLKKKKRKKMGSVWKKTGWRVNRWFTKTSYPVPAPSCYAQYTLLPKICREKSLSTWCKTRVKTSNKGEDRIAWESQSSPLPQEKERKILQTSFPLWVFPATRSQLLKHLFASLGKGEERD